ncbi:hypothetical protein [Phocaeicola abscessus]|uniref:hypothetical protein n=1 Tax=Phocaeicola abscessus TaxID=555313 RepID=UPI0004BB1269|nr:hypothetical protein [Phocaeicola abscessus]
MNRFKTIWYFFSVVPTRFGRSVSEAFYGFDSFAENRRGDFGTGYKDEERRLYG